MNQIERDKRAIRIVLQLLGRAPFAEIALRAGEGLYPAMRSMIEAGEVVCEKGDGTIMYRLPDDLPTPKPMV